MKNKLIKTFVVILTLFITFFIGSNKVKADNDTCYWRSPLTYMNKEGGIPTLESHFEYEASDVSKVGPDVLDRTDVTAFLLKYSKKGYAGYSIASLNYNIEGGGNIANTFGGYNIYHSDHYVKFDFDKSSCKSQKYVVLKAYLQNGSNYIFQVKPATEEEYISYLKKGNITWTFKAYTTREDASHIYDAGYSDSSKNSFWNYVYRTDGIYFVNTNFKESYPNDKYGRLVSELVSTKGWDKSEIDAKFSKLNIDPSDKNRFTVNKVYYDSTRTLWEKYYKDRDSKKNRSGFKNWFYRVNRYVLEENLYKFKEYFMFANENNTNDVDYNNVIDIIDGMIALEKNDDKKSCLESNPCSVFCHAGSNAQSFTCSGTAFDQCSAGSDDYKKCSAAYKACEGARKGSSSTAYDDCMKMNMGEDLYEKYEDDKKTISDAIDQEKKDIADGIAEALQNVSTPQIKIKFEGYEVKCEDVVIFHDLYIILRIAAPILVIILGSLDYAKAVLASDVDQMEKSKKKFPKRLILVVLFMLIPMLIDLILSLYAKSTNIDISTNLMYCVLKG